MWSDWLTGADPQLHRWAAQQGDAATAWRTCPRADWVAGALVLAEGDRRALVGLACAFVRTIVDQLEARGWSALRAAEGWVVGERSDAEVRAVAAKVGFPLGQLAAGRYVAGTNAGWAAANAALAVSWPEAVVQVVVRVVGATLAPPDEVHGELLGLVHEQLWPVAPPPVGAPERVAVAWDWVEDRCPPVAVLSTVDLLVARSLLAGLGDPAVLRPLAERLVGAPALVARVRQLLRAG
ncbi:MAG: hypothetical protein R3F59_02345 [Myxococcota bacterium]